VTTTLIPALLAAVLVSLAALHVHWTAGGKWGLAAAVPEVGGKPLFRPSPAATFAVAVGLLLAALVAVLRGFFLLGSFPGSPAHWACVALGALFVLRAVGERRYVGFLKRVRGTPFAIWDTRLFSPLSLLLGLGFLYIATT